MEMGESLTLGIRYLHLLNGITTFSFAVLFSSLSLYLTKKIGLSQTEANGVVGFFLASNFVLHFVAGYIGDRLLTNRLLFALSTTIQVLGIFVLYFFNSLVYLGLSLFLIGCGLGSTCINCLITQQFEVHEDKLRERAFFYNYGAMNIGFLSGYLFSGLIDIKNNYENLFNISNIVNFAAVIFIFKAWKYLAKKSNETKINLEQRTRGILVVLSIVPVLYVGFYFSWLANYLILLLGVGVLMYVAILGYKSKKEIERRKIYSFLYLTITSIVFWMLYFVGPMGVTQFLKNNVSIYIGSYYIPPQWIMNLNVILVIIGSPILLFVFDILRKRNINISVSLQFVLSLIFISLSFIILSVGILFSGKDGLTGMNWIIAHYIFQAAGELLIGPVGYAMIGTLVPERYQSLMMGIWMMVSGIAVTLSNYFSNLMTQTESTSPLIKIGRAHV